MTSGAILFASYSSVLGGAERILLDVMPDGALLACPPGPLSDAARHAGVRILPLRARSLELRAGLRERVEQPLAIAGLAREVSSLVRGERPDVLVAWNMRALLACAPALAAARDRPRLVFAHNDFLPGPAIARAVGVAARRADLVVCLSRAIAAELEGHPGLEVVPAGVDLERFVPIAGAPSREVLVLGAIEPWKRPDLALEIAARVPDVRLRVAGEPVGAQGTALLADLRRRAGKPDLRGRVELAGRIADPVPALHRAGALLHCADREPFGLALVEALACGVPVVAPAAAGPLEIVGDAGALYPPGDAAAGAAALRDVLDPGRRNGLAQAARARAERLFDVRQARERWQDLLA